MGRVYMNRFIVAIRSSDCVVDENRITQSRTDLSTGGCVESSGKQFRLTNHDKLKTTVQ